MMACRPIKGEATGACAHLAKPVPMKCSVDRMRILLFYGGSVHWHTIFWPMFCVIRRRGDIRSMRLDKGKFETPRCVSRTVDEVNGAAGGVGGLRVFCVPLSSST